MELEVTRTAAGHAAFADPDPRLPEACRSLLASLHKTLFLDEWVAGVQGARMLDGAALLADGLVQVLWSPGVHPERTAAQRLIDVLRGLESEEVYALLTEQARSRLGLLRGFQLILLLERCFAASERRALAVWLVLDLWRRKDAQGLNALWRRADPTARGISFTSFIVDQPSPTAVTESIGRIQ